MTEELKKSFGINFKIKEIGAIKGLPVYMVAGRCFYILKTDNIEFLAVKLSSADKFGSVALEKQMQKYSEITGKDVVFVFDRITSFQRDSLISHKINFIVPEKQIYIPFLGVHLRNQFQNKKLISSEKMMPATQCLFLYLLYNSNHKGIIKSQAADALHLTRTSITRASDQLANMSLISQQSNGKEVLMFPEAFDKSLYENAKPYLINPVQKSMIIKQSDLPECAVYSGETALGRKTMLNAPKIDVYAISKNNELIKNLKTYDLQWCDSENLAVLQLWKYDPLLFSREDCADVVSLAESFKDNADERIEEAIEQYMEEYGW